MPTCPRTFITAALLIPAITLAGCASSGLSPRETRGSDISSFTPASFRLEHTAERSARQPLGTAPLSIVAVQIGEVAPPQKMLDRLRDEPTLFASVQPSSGVVAQVYHPRRSREIDLHTNAATREHAQMLLQGARDMGADALLIYGGTIDADDRGTPLSLLDITLVGAFVVPSRILEAEGRATAMLIDAETGRIMATTSADATDTGLTTTFGKRGAQRNQMQDIRDEVVDELTTQLIQSLHARRGVETDTTAQARS